ncbi:hypothetical protein BTA51_01445 [Hahella sp. CCB-MM4]|uniref:leucine-rich repeat domain-containing protein n=1 Tax=Hahella sp. (strain CCB-MM4) TaxID=1926491 RepID=UPI000B9BE438|nr:leucine-rich repeat domain-containing protein [Hahella sp. CCB-MM4]OZG75089.1 hypothetical protein BTA51_01445 [Hahella sp. CCB-MM4]
MDSKGISTILVMVAVSVMMAGCDNGGVPRASIDKSTVVINSLSAENEVMERDISFFNVTFTARDSLSGSDYDVTWRVVDASGLPVTSWTSSNAFGGQASESPACFGVEYVATPAPAATPDPDSTAPTTRQVAFLAPPVNDDTTLTVEVAVSADEGVEEENIVTATKRFDILVKAFPDAGTLVIADGNLNTCVTNAINACPDGTEYDDLGIYQLSCETTVNSLSGVQALSRMQALSLTQLDAADLTPIDALTNMRQLELSGATDQTSYAGLGMMGNLNDLRLNLDISTPGAFALADLQPILANLDNLELCVADLADISLLPEAVNLSSLTICDTGDDGIEDASFIGQLTQMTSLTYNKGRSNSDDAELVIDFSIFQPLHLLRTLTATSQLPTATERGADLSPLSDLNVLENLTINAAQVGSLTPLATLSDLTTLDLSTNYIVDVSPLGDLTTLENLYLSHNRIPDDISALETLQRLKILDLEDNGVIDISAIGEMRQLRTLDLETNQLTSVSALNGLSRLTSINVSDNPSLGSLSILRTTGVTTLEVRSLGLTSDSFVALLNDLVTLDISDNQLLSGVSNIVSNETLTTLTLDECVFNSASSGEQDALNALNLTKVGC